jgi:hypothetical protein
MYERFMLRFYDWWDWISPSVRYTVGGAVLLVSIIFWCCHTRTEVRVTAIDEGYDIRITRFGRTLWISSEGLLPSWSDTTTLIAEGNSANVVVDGVSYRKYPLRIGLCSKPDDMLSGGAIYISEQSKRMIVEGAQTSLKRRYDNIVTSHPTIVPLKSDTRVTDVDGRYVRATGHFKGWDFETAGKSLYTNNLYNMCGIDESPEYEVIGVFHAHDGVGRDQPGIRIVKFKRTPSK